MVESDKSSWVAQSSKFSFLSEVEKCHGTNNFLTFYLDIHNSPTGGSTGSTVWHITQ